MKVVEYYKFFYLDQYEVPQCSGWTSDDWFVYMDGYHRNEQDLGDDNPLVLLKIEMKQFTYDENLESKFDREVGNEV